ncbi:MAG: hypothetical protein ACRDEB_01880 [Chitinophagaceae bacterium]
MNNNLYIFFSLLLFAPVISFSQQKNVIIKVSQDETFTADEFQTNLQLRKRTFKIKVMLDHMDGVYVFASVRDSVYRFTETSPIRDFAYLKLLEIREEDKFNANKELSLSETGWSYWFYNDSAEWHPFSQNIIRFDKDRYVCTKSIKELYDVSEGKVIKFRNLNKPLYLFFIAVKEYDKDGKPLTELLRRKIKIDWLDDE